MAKSTQERKRDKILARLERIRQANGGVITPKLVVEDAKKRSSPLHGEFVWDVHKAAEIQWEATARRILASYKFVVRTEKTEIKAPYYVRDSRMDPHEQGYTALSDVRSNTEMALETLRYEFSRALSILERACNVADGLGMGQEFGELLKRADVIRLRLFDAA